VPAPGASPAGNPGSIARGLAARENALRKKKKSVRLQRETVRQLAEEALDKVAGDRPLAHGQFEAQPEKSGHCCTNEATGCLT
jgi:hypothetical protein